MAIPLLMFPSTIIRAISGLLIPEFSDYKYTKNFIAINSISKKIFKISFLFSIYIMGIFWTFSDKLSLLIYKNTEVSYFLKILCPLVLFMYMDDIVDNILKGLDKQVSVMFANIIDLFTSIALICLLLPIKGAYGYIIVIFISELLNFAISIHSLIKLTNLKINFVSWIIKPFFCITISYFVTYLLNLNLKNTNIDILVNILIFSLSYFTLYFIFDIRNLLNP